RSYELQERRKAHLREVGQPRLAAVVLEVRIRGEARYRVERKRWLHVGDTVRVQEQPGLQRYDGESSQPHKDVGDDDGSRISLPVLLLVWIDHREPKHHPLDRHKYRIKPRTAARK